MLHGAGEASFTLKVPPEMRSDLSYLEWKKEVTIWQRGTTVAKEKQGIALAWRLKGNVRKTIFQEVDIDKMDCADGVKNILEALDNYFKQDTAQAGLVALDSLIEYRRPPHMSYKEFVMNFHVKYNAIKAYDMTLPDNILAGFLLRSANLPPEKVALCRATCGTLTPKNMGHQIEKVGVSGECSTASITSPHSSNSAHFDMSKVKIEKTYLGQCQNNDQSDTDYVETSDDNQGYYSNYDVSNSKVLYGQSRNQSRGSYNKKKQFGSKGHFRYNDRPKFNAPGDDGRPSTCGFCHSICHYIADCPDAPDHLKVPRYKRYPARRSFKQPL